MKKIRRFALVGNNFVLFKAKRHRLIIISHEFQREVSMKIPWASDRLP